MPDAIPTEQELRPVPSFKEVLLQSAFSKGRVISDSVSEIDLAIFGNEGRNLVSQMIMDPKRREYGKLVYVTKDRKVLLQEQPTVGNETNVTHSFKADILIDNPALPWFMRQNRILGTTVHSHPEDIPPSSEDLLNLLIGDFDYGVSLAVFVSSPKRNFVIFRGRKTPQFTREQLVQKIILWERSIEERVMKFADPFMSTSEQMEINNRARTALLRQIGQKYDLKIFTGDSDSQKVTLLS